MNGVSLRSLSGHQRAFDSLPAVHSAASILILGSLVRDLVSASACHTTTRVGFSSG